MTDSVDDDPTGLSLPRTPWEGLALADGQLAMLDLLAARTPSPARFAAFHKLRCAARLDPAAAFYLGNYFADPPCGCARAGANAASPCSAMQPSWASCGWTAPCDPTPTRRGASTGCATL